MACIPTLFLTPSGNIEEQTYLMMSHQNSVNPSDIKYPTNLKKLIFIYNPDKGTEQTITFPDTIIDLELRTCASFEFFVFPKNLKKLKIRPLFGKDVSKIVFPESLSFLSFSGVVQNIQKMKFPKSLEYLVIEDYTAFDRQELSCSNFPETLTVIWGEILNT